jgi:hypothetical protein
MGVTSARGPSICSAETRAAFRLGFAERVSADRFERKGNRKGMLRSLLEAL